MRKGCFDRCLASSGSLLYCHLHANFTALSLHVPSVRFPSMAKVAINLNEKLPFEEDDVGDPAQALNLASDDPPPAAGSTTDHAFNASAEPPLPPSDCGSNRAHKEDESKKTVAVIGSVAVNSSAAPVDNIQKKIRRAERFGVPVQLSEAEKRNSRAERFGINSGMKKSESLNNSEELKRKARAERFGILASEVDEEKKKARLERFASNTKTVSDEEEKRKARAIRFSNVPSSLSQVNGKAAVAGGDSRKS